MIPEIGFFSLLLALGLTLIQAMIPLIGSYQNKEAWMRMAFPAALGQCFFLSLAFLCLLYAFSVNDFSVQYIAAHSNASLPLLYKITAIWGGHEGSILLWSFLLSMWTVAVSQSVRNFVLPFSARVLSILGLINLAFLLFIIFTSNPFARVLPHYPIDGKDLNPLLQDPGFIIHPPLLYMGYVGLAVPFAATMAILLMNKIETAWIHWMRSWVLAAFAFLTIGIALGSWWAYYELGWGGWWFWDPVENASFMPWLIGLALIHSLIVSDKRQQLYGLTFLLSIVAFGLSLLGTFLVRSGVLTSVHAFASDPERGIFLLWLFGLVIGSALLLFALRVPRYSDHAESAPDTFEWCSRETLILCMSLFLLVACGAVLLGTLFPLILDALTHQKISVGFPYFNRVFIPLMIPVLCMVPLGPIMHWGMNPTSAILKQVKRFFWGSIVFSFIVFLLYSQGLYALKILELKTVFVLLGLTLGSWIILGTLRTLKQKIQKRGGLKSVTLPAWGMVTAHIGMGITVIGITLVSQYQIEQEMRVALHDKIDLAGYTITFEALEKVEGSNYLSDRAHFVVSKNNQKITDLFPEKRTFVVSGSKMTETAIDAGFLRDIYISLGEPLEKEIWSARFYYKPFVRWIWLGALFMAVGALFSAWGRFVKG